MGLNVEQLPKETKELKLVEGDEITLNAPFTYQIGDKGFHSGIELNTMEDCITELRAEIDEGNLNSLNVLIQLG